MKNELHKCRTTSQVIHLLIDIAEIVGHLEGVKLLKPNPGLRRRNRIQTIQASLSIEGNSLTSDQVTALLDNKRVIGPGQDILAAQNAICAYGQLDGFDPFSITSFLKAHEILMEGLITSTGMLRTGPIGVIRQGEIFHEAPSWENVDPMMQTLFAYLKKNDDHLLLKSSRFHFQLEHIHPFVDGNGRMGRLWQTCLLMAYHPIFEFLPVADFIKKRQSGYYRELAIGDDTGDCTGFVVFMLSVIRESLQELMVETRSVRLTASVRLEMAAHSFGDHSFSRRDYQSFFKTISTATASRDLKEGVKKGLLEKTGDKRTAIYKRLKVEGMGHG